MDSDGSGAIDVDEITTAFNTCGIAFQKSDMKAILKDLDNEVRACARQGTYVS